MANTPITYTLSAFNSLPEAQAKAALHSLCTSEDWVDAMQAAMPFESIDELQTIAKDLWSLADEASLLQAFSGHAKIGDVHAIRKKFAAATEQGQVLESSDEVIKELAQFNNDYDEKFGFIFIVCATGLSAETMLGYLKERIGNSRDKELHNAAAEQGKIIQLRIQKTIMSEKSNLSTHVLDSSTGKPAQGIGITLMDADKNTLATATTNDDGRIDGWSSHVFLNEGQYFIEFDTAAYFTSSDTKAFYPSVCIHFEIADSSQHYHVPLLLSPFGYSTYRGS